MNTVTQAKVTLAMARACLATKEEKLRALEAAHPAHARCEAISAKIEALEPEQFGGDLDKWEAACDELLAEMKAPSDELFEAMRGLYAERDLARAAVRTAEGLLFEAVLTALPMAMGQALPPKVAQMLEDGVSGCLFESFRPKLVDVCLRWQDA